MCFIRIANKGVLSKSVFEINSDTEYYKKKKLVKRWPDGEEIKTKESGHRNSDADRARVSPWSFEG